MIRVDPLCVNVWTCQTASVSYYKNYSLEARTMTLPRRVAVRGIIYKDGKLLCQQQTAKNGVLPDYRLSLIHISEPTRRTPISYAVFCLKKKKKNKTKYK